MSWEACGTPPDKQELPELRHVCGDAGHDEGRCGNASCCRGTQPAPAVAPKEQ